MIALLSNGSSKLISGSSGTTGSPASSSSGRILQDLKDRLATDPPRCGSPRVEATVLKCIGDGLAAVSNPALALGSGGPNSDPGHPTVPSQVAKLTGKRVFLPAPCPEWSALGQSCFTSKVKLTCFYLGGGGGSYLSSGITKLGCGSSSVVSREISVKQMKKYI